MVGLAVRSAVGRGSGSARDLPGQLFADEHPHKPASGTLPTTGDTLGFDFTPEVLHTRGTPVNGTKVPVPVATQGRTTKQCGAINQSGSGLTSSQADREICQFINRQDRGWRFDIRFVLLVTQFKDVAQASLHTGRGQPSPDILPILLRQPPDVLRRKLGEI